MRFPLALAVSLLAGPFLYYLLTAEPSSPSMQTEQPAVNQVPEHSSAAAPLSSRADAYRAEKQHVDAPTVRNGVLTIDYRLRLYFEFFLLQRDSLSHEALFTQLQADALQRYDAQTADYLLKLFQRFLSYLDAEARLGHDEEADQVFVRRQELREQMFSRMEQQALFEFEGMPDVAGSAATQREVDAYYQALQTAPDEAREGLRVAHFGMEVAARFKQLDEARERWQQKLVDYQCQAQLIEEAEGLAEQDKLQQISALQQRLFNVSEVRRLQALERNQLLPAADC